MKPFHAIATGFFTGASTFLNRGTSLFRTISCQHIRTIIFRMLPPNTRCFFAFFNQCWLGCPVSWKLQRPLQSITIFSHHVKNFLKPDSIFLDFWVGIICFGRINTISIPKFINLIHTDSRCDIDFIIPQPADLGLHLSLGFWDVKINVTLTHGW